MLPDAMAVVSCSRMQPANRVALKEWAVICRELAAGRQIIVLRKGGIREQSRGFSVEHQEFFLFPTYVHQNEQELVSTARATLADVARSAPPDGELRLDLYAVVTDVLEVHDLESLRGLAGQHSLAWPAVESRFRYRRPGLHVIALRVYRLPKPLSVSYLPRYDGCRSWVQLEPELPVLDAEPVLDDEAFRDRLGHMRAVLARARSMRPQAGRQSA